MKFNKLVRDRIPNIIAANGEIAVTEVLDGKRYIEELRKKLSEEVAEFLESDDSEEELADIMEVVYSIWEMKGYSKEELDSIRREKEEKRWWFKNRIFLIETKKSSD